MSNEEKFRETLNEKLASKEFAFDEDNWENARMLIDANKPQRRIIPFLLTAFVLGLTGAGTWIAFMPPANALSVNRETVVKATPSNNINTKQPSTIAEKQNRTVQATNVQADETSEHQPNQAAAKDPAPVKMVSTPAVVKETPASNEKTKMPVSKSVPPVEKVKAQEPVTPVTAAAPILSNDQKSTEVKTPESQYNSMKAAGDIVSDIKDPNTQPDQSSDNVVKSVQEPITNRAVNEPVQKAEPIASVPTTNAAPVSNIPDQPKTDPANNNGEQIVSDQNPVAAAPTTVTNADAPKDTIAAIAARPDTDYVSHRKLHFNVEAGGLLLKGWKNAERTDAAGINPYVGINYITDLGNSMQFLIGAQYTSVGNLRNTTYTAKISRLGLGEESHVSVYTPLKMHYLVVPLRLEYAHDLSNHFGLGLNIAYLMTMKSRLETYDQKLNSIANYQTTTVTGYTEGFRNFDYQLSGFYKRRLVNAELIYGLTDVKSDDFYATRTFERHVGIKLGLVYNLFKEIK